MSNSRTCLENLTGEQDEYSTYSNGCESLSGKTLQTIVQFSDTVDLRGKALREK